MIVFGRDIKIWSDKHRNYTDNFDTKSDLDQSKYLYLQNEMEIFKASGDIWWMKGEKKS